MYIYLIFNYILYIHYIISHCITVFKIFICIKTLNLILELQYDKHVTFHIVDDN